LQTYKEWTLDGLHSNQLELYTAVFIVLSADDDGEEGTFALNSFLARYAHIVRRDPNIRGTVRLDRYHTGDMKPLNNGLRAMIESSHVAKVILMILGVLGVAMVMS
jgi:KUP system potassium uptake protein